MAEGRQEKLQRLASRICAGDVVFFIGAGFSLDSEGNTAKVLIARLLARFEALTEWAIASGTPEAREAASCLRAGLRVTFDLRDKTTRELHTDLFADAVRADVLTTLAQSYYLINDWTCTAFDSLIDVLFPRRPSPQGRGAAPAALALEVHAREMALLETYCPSPALDPIDVAFLRTLRQNVDDTPMVAPERYVCGKALFLDTLGFNNPSVMGGCPLDYRLDKVVADAEGKVLTRHHVLAWLAAEGLCSTLVTTNYDLLLDCAHRLAGLLPLDPEPTLWGSESEIPLDLAKRLRLPLNRRYRHFTRVSEAAQFFTHGDAHESATIHKIHGCVEAYRLARSKNDLKVFRKVLPTIVFTFREIQNWREDSWSRDHLTTLLRTRTIVFSGYSLADPVIHDTFRTVYEDVAKYRTGLLDAPSSADPPGARARAFFTDLEEAGNFHGLEVLRAASVASGDYASDVSDHPNRVSFYSRDDKDQRFPTIDEIFVWTYHLTARELQAHALETEIRGIASQLLGVRRPEDEITAITDAFAYLRQRECAVGRGFDTARTAPEIAAARLSFQRLSDWTAVFAIALMREYQLAQSLLSHPTDAFPIQEAARYPWYRPLTEHPHWTAWGVVLELAIRRLLSWQAGVPAQWAEATREFEVVNDICPMIRFDAPQTPAVQRNAAERPDPPVKRVLTIEVTALRDRFARYDRRRLFAARPPLTWVLQPETMAWWRQNDSRRPASTPAARTIWDWARCGAGACDRDVAARILEGRTLAHERRPA